MVLISIARKLSTALLIFSLSAMSVHAISAQHMTIEKMDQRALDSMTRILDALKSFSDFEKKLLRDIESANQKNLREQLRRDAITAGILISEGGADAEPIFMPGRDKVLQAGISPAIG